MERKQTGNLCSEALLAPRTINLRSHAAFRNDLEDLLASISFSDGVFEKQLSLSKAEWHYDDRIQLGSPISFMKGWLQTSESKTARLIDNLTATAGQCKKMTVVKHTPSTVMNQMVLEVDMVSPACFLRN